MVTTSPDPIEKSMHLFSSFNHTSVFNDTTCYINGSIRRHLNGSKVASGEPKFPQFARTI